MNNLLGRPNGAGAPARKCETCRFDGMKWDDEPCHSCMRSGRFNYWEPKESAQTEVDWIPCSERLPEDDADVLVTTVYRDGTKGVEINCYDSKSDEWGNSADVIAWIPLPGPYEG